MLTEEEQAAHEYVYRPIDAPVIELPVWDIINRADADRGRAQRVMDSMQKEGQKEPIWVAKMFGKWRVIEGRHRLIAARTLEWKTIKAQDITYYEN